MRFGKLKVILEIIPFVQLLLNCSEEPLDLPNAHWGCLPHPQGEKGLRARVPQSLPLGQFGFYLFYILKFLI